MRVDIYLSAALVALFGAAFLMSIGFRWQVALAPGLASGIGFCLVAVHLVRSVSVRAKEARDTPIGVHELIKIGWFLAAVFSVAALGFAAGGGMFVFAYTIAHQSGHRSILKAVFCALPVPLVTIVLFQEFLGIQLFAGILFD